MIDQQLNQHDAPQMARDVTEPLGRPFDLYRANLSGQSLWGDDLRRADLREANLSNADLSATDLRGAALRRANLSHADLTIAQLTGAWLLHANLSGANLTLARLTNADLKSVKLDGQAQLDDACGKPKALPPDLTLDKMCGLLPTSYLE